MSYRMFLRAALTLGSRSAVQTHAVTTDDSIRPQGAFNMSPSNHNGMDERARVLVVVKDGGFGLLAQ